VNIGKAIEGSQEAVTFLGIHNQPRLANAVKLGIEALERLQWYKEVRPRWYIVSLPGKTKE